MPELVETIEKINYWLERDFGKWEDGQPRFRVVWANDQREMRRTEYTDEGIQLLHPEIRELPKYQHCWGFYVLEQLSVVPPGSDILTKLSYEPLWVFRDKDDKYLPPRYEVARIVIDAMYARKNEFRPVEKEDSEEVLRKRKAELTKVEQDLFGNNTPVGDALAYGWGVSLTGPRFEGSNKTASEEAK